MITLKNVSFSYPNSEPVLNRFDLHIEKSEKVGLVGCNGAGKSTLLSLICGIHLPEEGTIRIDDTMLKKETLPEIRKKVGLVFQNPDDQLFMPNILEDVAFGPKNYGMQEKEAKAKAMETLKRMEIASLAERPPYRLSGGEKRSAAIATVLAMDPSVILFDEPSAFLDPRAARNFEKTVIQLPVTYIIASHDLDLSRRTCTRVLIMKKGVVLADGKPNQLLNDEKLLADVNLELPESYRRCRECPYRKR